jgi:hypothetical protein
VDQAGVRIVDLDGWKTSSIPPDHQAAPGRFVVRRRRLVALAWYGDLFRMGRRPTAGPAGAEGLRSGRTWVCVRDHHNHLVPVDGTRLEPIWAAAASWDCRS